MSPRFAYPGLNPQDPCAGWLSSEHEPSTATVPPGDYRVEPAVIRFLDDPTHLPVAAAKLVVSAKPVASWELALTAG
ncbi:DUF4241 domain-containing protein [Saccharothrix isguenensis]